VTISSEGEDVSTRDLKKKLSKKDKKSQSSQKSSWKIERGGDLKR
jgi:hypothetical protein